MKTIIALAIALSASAAMALDKNSSWSEILGSGATLVFEENLGGIALENACLTATEVQSIRATKNCANLVPVEHKEGDSTWTDWVCEKYVVSKVTYPRTTEKSVCMEYGYEQDNFVCTQYGTVHATVASSINVTVEENGFGENGNYGFTKVYTFPACK